MSLKDIYYLELWQPLFSVERNHLCDFGRRHREEKFCENKLIWTSGLGDVVLRYFSSGALVTFLFSGVEPFLQFWLRVL